MKQQLLAKLRQIAARHRQAAGPRALSGQENDQGSLYIYEMIGEDWWTGGGVTAKKVVDALEALKGVKTLNIFINSEGGDIFEAKAIIENLERFDAEKVVYVDGLAASAASFIAMVGDRIITSPVATWMIHEAWSVALGRAADLRAMADLLDMQNRTMAETYATQTGGTTDEMLELMAAETWMDARQAKERGFTDEIAREDASQEEAAAAATTSPLMAIAAQTNARVALARQKQRLRQLSARASPGRTAHGQP